MCRVALFNKKGQELIEDKIGLVEFLAYLEASCGGHGNGIALLKEDGSIKIKKGVNFKVEEIATILKEVDYKWCIFHTRIASVGNVSDKNCHPFRSGNTVLAMNGTESGFGKVGDWLGGITDTEAVLRTIKRLQVPVVDALSTLSSVFMGFQDGVPFVTAGEHYTDLELIYEDKAICFASEFPYGIQSYEPLNKPFKWWEGKKIEVVKVPQYTKYDKYSKYNKYYAYAMGYEEEYEDYGNNYESARNYDDYKEKAKNLPAPAPAPSTTVSTAKDSSDSDKIPVYSGTENK
jgi:hypothetical protein